MFSVGINREESAKTLPQLLPLLMMMPPLPGSGPMLAECGGCNVIYRYRKKRGIGGEIRGGGGWGERGDKKRQCWIGFGIARINYL